MNRQILTLLLFYIVFFSSCKLEKISDNNETKVQKSEQTITAEVQEAAHFGTSKRDSLIVKFEDFNLIFYGLSDSTETAEVLEDTTHISLDLITLWED